MYGLILYSLAIGLTGWSFYRDNEKTKNALKVALRSFVKILPTMLAIVGITGLVLAIIPPEWISTYLGEQAGIYGPISAGLIGSLTLIPGLVAIPLVGTIYRQGASIYTVAIFISTLTMVGIVTLPAEIEQLGKKLAIWRNGLSLAFAILIALILGVIFS